MLPDSLATSALVGNPHPYVERGPEGLAEHLNRGSYDLYQLEFDGGFRHHLGAAAWALRVASLCRDFRAQQASLSPVTLRPFLRPAT